MSLGGHCAAADGTSCGIIAGRLVYRRAVIALCPVCVDGGVFAELGVLGDLCAVLNLHVPAVKDVADTGGSGQRGQLAVRTSGQRCRFTFTAVGIECDENQFCRSGNVFLDIHGIADGNGFTVGFVTFHLGNIQRISAHQYLLAEIVFAVRICFSSVFYLIVLRKRNRNIGTAVNQLAVQVGFEVWHLTISLGESYRSETGIICNPTCVGIRHFDLGAMAYLAICDRYFCIIAVAIWTIQRVCIGASLNAVTVNYAAL